MDRGAWWAIVHGVTKSHVCVCTHAYIIYLYKQHVQREVILIKIVQVFGFAINIHEYIYSCIFSSQMYRLSLDIFVNVQKIDAIYNSFLWKVHLKSLCRLGREFHPSTLCTLMFDLRGTIIFVLLKKKIRPSTLGEKKKLENAFKQQSLLF